MYKLEDLVKYAESLQNKKEDEKKLQALKLKSYEDIGKILIEGVAQGLLVVSCKAWSRVLCKHHMDRLLGKPTGYFTIGSRGTTISDDDEGYIYPTCFFDLE